MRKKKVYISLLITGQNLDELEARCLFTSAVLEKFGFELVSPLNVSDDPEASYEEHIGNDITALPICDAVLSLEGWKESRGCNLEHEAARIYEKTMLFTIEEINKNSIE